MLDSLTNPLSREILRKSDGMPLELVNTINELNEVELNEALLISFKHIERLVSFKNFSNDFPIDDVDQFWSDLVIRIEDTSYYACMALPYLRQILEFGTSYEFRPGNNLKDDEVLDKRWGSLLEEFDFQRKTIILNALEIADDLNRIEIEHIRDKERLIEVSHMLYLLGGKIVVLSSKLMTSK